MTIFKTYQAKLPYFELHTDVIVKGVKVFIKFLNGTKYPDLQCGKYSTTDTDIQNAIEQSPVYGKMYELLSETIDNSESEKPVKQPVKATEVKGIIETKAQEDSTGIDTESLVGIGIASGQKAKDFIRKHFPDVPFSRLRSNDEIKQVAKEKGITFPDWTI